MGLGAVATDLIYRAVGLVVGSIGSISTPQGGGLPGPISAVSCWFGLVWFGFG